MAKIKIAVIRATLVNYPRRLGKLVNQPSLESDLFDVVYSSIAPLPVISAKVFKTFGIGYFISHCE
jgi:hypothetical protein